MAIENRLPPKRKPVSRTAPVWVLIFTVFFIELMAYTWIRTEATRAQADIVKTRGILAKALAYQDALESEKDYLKAGDLIRHKATQGLVKETTVTTVYLKKGEQG